MFPACNTVLPPLFIWVTITASLGWPCEMIPSHKFALKNQFRKHLNASIRFDFISNLTQQSLCIDLKAENDLLSQIKGFPVNSNLASFRFLSKDLFAYFFPWMNIWDVSCNCNSLWISPRTFVLLSDVFDNKHPWVV